MHVIHILFIAYFHPFPPLPRVAAPSIIMAMTSFPANGPIANTQYILTCSTTITPSSLNGTLSLKWLHSNGNPVLSDGDNRIVDQDGYNISLTFSSVSDVDEDMYTCQGSMTIYGDGHSQDTPTVIINTVSSTVTAPGTYNHF